MKIANCLALITVAFSLSGCVPKHAQAPKVEYYTHAVRFEGETLGLISSWYTGKSANWKEILSHNPGLNVHSIMIGDQIRIPAKMISRKGALPARIVPKNEEIIIEQVANTDEIELEAEPKVEALTQPEAIEPTEPNLEARGSVMIEQVALVPNEQTPSTTELVSSDSSQSVETQVTQDLAVSSESQLTPAQPRRKIPSREELWDALGKSE